MTYSEEFWQAYIRRLSVLDQTAGQLLAQYIQRHGVADSEALAQYAYALATKYGEASAELACQMYDAAAEAAGAQVPAAVPAPTASPQDVQRMVMGALQSPPLLRNGVARLVKQAAADTTLQNAARDGAEFAWVPHGDSCAFCITLASRGWQRMGKKAREGIHATHIHANCDCEYAVRFDGKSGVAGYDPDRYLAQYNAAGGDIKAMRRAQYAENKDKINAQKRAAYKARKEREQAEKAPQEGAGSTAQTALGRQAGRDTVPAQNSLTGQAKGRWRDVTREYLEAATPGVGSVTQDDGYKVGKHAAEIKMAQWLHETLGGDIRLLQENLGGPQKPDYEWNTKAWELKTISSEKAAESAVRGALKQIAENPGGIVLDCQMEKLSMNTLAEIVKSRIERSGKFPVDVLVVYGESLEKALRYKK